MAKFILFEDTEEYNGTLVNLDNISHAVQNEGDGTTEITMMDGSQIEVLMTIDALGHLMAKQVTIHVG